MPFDASPEPSMFPEAEAYFRQLVPMSASDYAALSGEEKRRAFTVAAAEQLEVVQTLHEEIARAIQTGEGYESFAKRVKSMLKSTWANVGSHRLETVFRTNVQTAYTTGRWYQQQDAELTAVRPWVMFDWVDDERTSPICRGLGGPPPTVKRHDDPYVATNWPPLHHRCRSQWQSISNRKARELGGETSATNESSERPSAGFGLAPPLASDWRPDGGRYEPALMKIHDQKVESLRGQL